jgi:tetraacyldisaccharide 4'-kinase
VGRRRAAAGQFLLGRHPELDVLIADDGLQHYALARTVEVAVFDARGAGNGRLLPAGPLREPIGRLATVDAVVFNEAPHGAAQLGLERLVPSPPTFQMQLAALDATQLVDPSRRVPLSQLRDQTLLAAAGIGAPERFFAMLARAGLRCAQLPLPDHFDYRIDPFRGRSEQLILITEKDAVKCRHLNDARLWVVPVEAILEEKFVSLVLEKLRAWK